jgi:hypothetical protein
MQGDQVRQTTQSHRISEVLEELPLELSGPKHDRQESETHVANERLGFYHSEIILQ